MTVLTEKTNLADDIVETSVVASYTVQQPLYLYNSAENLPAKIQDINQLWIMQPTEYPPKMQFGIIQFGDAVMDRQTDGGDHG